MPRALEMLDHAVRQLERGEASALELIDTLLAEELSVRETSRIKTALRMGRLTTIKTIAGFDFSFQPSLDRERILALAELQFVDRREVVHFLGPPGTGKSHLAVALGVEGVKAGRSVYFITLADIVGALAKAEREGQLRERIGWFGRSALLIVDEIGYLPVAHGGGNLFFQLVNARYEKGAMILTSNRGFAEWGEIFGDSVVATALLDRLLHAPCRGHPDRRLQLPPAPARRSDARAPALQGTDQLTIPGSGPAPPRPPAKIITTRSGVRGMNPQLVAAPQATPYPLRSSFAE
jgi:DNA replication protein DnaC